MTNSPAILLFAISIKILFCAAAAAAQDGAPVTINETQELAGRGIKQMTARSP